MPDQRYFLELAYFGTPFKGWQRQPDTDTVQGRIEEALRVLTREDIAITGCGRTDTGVHASNYFAHLDLPEAMQPKLEGVLTERLNGLLPKAIRIHCAYPMHADAHARFDAVQRAYAYRLHRREDPFLEGYSYRYPYPEWDLDAMNKAADGLRRIGDFTSFMKTGSDAKTPHCRVDLAFWEPDPQAPKASEGWVFRIVADRFLRGMVRLIVGAILEVGRGRLSPEAFLDTVVQKERFQRSTAAPAHGLYLHRIRYPYAVGDHAGLPQQAP
jgi:tRNA pseudouridine38-40 synthase